MQSVKSVVESIKKYSDFTLVSNENEMNEDDIELVKNINFAAGHILLVISDEPNDKLGVWDQIVKEYSISDVKIDSFIVNAFMLLHIVSSEFLRYAGQSTNVKKAKKTLDNSLELAKSSGLYENIKEKIKFYEDYLCFTFQEQRVEKLYSKELELRFDNALGGQERRIEKISEELNSTKDLLEAIESETGHASLVHGFKEYSKKLNEKKRKLNGETKSLTYLIFLVPTLSALLSLMLGDLGYGFYVSAASAMAILGLLLRVNIRKEDQLDQVFTKIDNRIALSIFYRYQITEGNEEDRKEAASKFNSFIYSEIETSDWNAPDLTEGIVKAVKEIKRK